LPEKELKPRELVLAATVARRYFIEGKAKTEIGAEFGISRFRVARIIDQARESGLVRIEIALPAEIDPELSERLRAAYGLRHAIAVRTSEQPEESLRSHLGAVTAGLLTEIVEEGDILGVGWGRTLDAMTSALKKLPPCTVVQLTGAAGTLDVTEDSVEIVRRVAAVSGGPAFAIYAPIIVDTAEAATALRRQPHVAEALRRFDRVTKAVVAIGSWDPPNSQLHDTLDNVAREALRKKRVRAEVCSTLIDDEGKQIVGDLMDRSISISAEQLRRVPEVVAVAGGRSKVAAIRAVPKAGFITSLVTDTGAGEALVSMAGRAPDFRPKPARRR
jgi:DNA-binding transcriptional regulator LsrR (DeoR family)